jgi:NAD(P)-dependent dehydrogenase (short-subunit alcohol dehydrogenase family)
MTQARFDGRVAVITGATSGIGRAAAQMLAAEGARVLVSDIRDPDWLPDQEGIVFQHADARSFDDAEALMRRAADEWGRLDILFNNAGTPGRLPRPPAIDLPVEDWDETVDLNLKGTFLNTKAALPYLLDSGGGAIVNNASMLGVVGLPDSAAYCASKGGVVQLTKALALELIPHNIRVNCVCASFIDTKMFNDWLELQDDPEAARREAMEKLPIGRLGTAEDVARAALFLMSEDASFIVGHALYGCGGYLAQ